MSEFEVNGGQGHDHRGGQDHEGLQKRRNSMERYKPGAYFNEEREKLRRRAHFGERRLENTEQQERGRGRGRRGRGGRGHHNRGRGGNFTSYRNGTKNESDNDNDEEEQESRLPESPKENGDLPKIEFAYPPTIGNWADEVSDTSPETVLFEIELIYQATVDYFAYFLRISSQK